MIKSEEKNTKLFSKFKKASLNVMHSAASGLGLAQESNNGLMSFPKTPMTGPI